MATMHRLVTRFVSFVLTPWRQGVAVRIALPLAALVVALPAAAGAQTLGTYRWQLQPYCNIITVTVTQQGGNYTLDGTDDQCAAVLRASVQGMAFLNPNGSIGFGLTIVSVPWGVPIHVEAVILTNTLSGTWRDSGGRNGEFVLTPGPGEPGIGPLPPTSVLKAKFRNSSTVTALTSIPTILRAEALTIPVVGKVIANVSGYFALRSTGQDLARCSISTNGLIDSTLETRVDDFGNVASQAYVPMAMTRGFDVFPGSIVVYLVCERQLGAVEIRHTSLTAMFVPGPH